MPALVCVIHQNPLIASPHMFSAFFVEAGGGFPVNFLPECRTKRKTTLGPLRNM